MQLACVRLLAGALMVGLWVTAASAASLPPTTIYVKDMHCPACAKKIAARLYTVPGVVTVKTHVKKGLAIVQPQRKKNPSPKALWEAVEAAKFQPIKIASPLGTFTQKPRR